MSAEVTRHLAEIDFDSLRESEARGELWDFEESRLAAPDGTSLRVFEYGCPDAPVVVLVNPIGVPILLASRLMRQLGERYRTVCWEQRGCRNEPEYLQDERNDFALFLADLDHVVKSKARARPLVLLGICSGAALALKAVAQDLIQPASLILVSPAVRFKVGYSESLFDKSVVPYMRMIAAGDRRLAQGLLDIKTANAAQAHAASTEDERLIETADRWSLRCLESLLVYARTIRSFAEQSLDEELTRIRQEVHIVSAVDDQTVCIHSVRRLARHLVHANLIEFERGGHFLLFLSESARAAVEQIIARDLRRHGLGGQGLGGPGNPSVEESCGMEHE